MLDDVCCLGNSMLGDFERNIRVHSLSGSSTSVTFDYQSHHVDDNSISLTFSDMVHDTRLEPSSVQLLTAQAEPQRKKRCTNAAISSISHSEPSAAHASTKAHSGSSQTTKDSFGEHSSGDEVPDDQLIQNTADDQTSPKLKPFRFLDLAAELRDEVYEFVAVDHPYFVSKCGDFKATSALCAVNRQVRNEFLSILENASDIQATVARYNFQHIVRSMNRLPEQHARKLSASVGTSKKRNIVIALELPYATGDEKSQSTYTGWGGPKLARRDDMLGRWLNHFKKPEKRGATMSFSYIFIRPDPRWWDTKGDIIFAMYLMRTMKLDYTGRAQEEVVKMISALEVLLEAQNELS